MCFWVQYAGFYDATTGEIAQHQIIGEKIIEPVRDGCEAQLEDSYPEVMEIIKDKFVAGGLAKA